MATPHDTVRAHPQEKKKKKTEMTVPCVAQIRREIAFSKKSWEGLSPEVQSRGGDLGLLLVPRKDTALGLVGKRAESAVPRERQESGEKKRLKKVDNLDEICNRTSKSALYIGSEE